MTLHLHLEMDPDDPRTGRLLAALSTIFEGEVALSDTSIRPRRTERGGAEPIAVAPPASGGEPSDEVTKGRLTPNMAEVLHVLYEHESIDRDSLAAALGHTRSHNSIGRSLGALQRAGWAEPRYEGSGTWQITLIGKKVHDGEIKVEVEHAKPAGTP